MWYRYGHRIFYQITCSGYIEGYIIEIIRSTNYMVPMHAHKAQQNKDIQWRQADVANLPLHN